MVFVCFSMIFYDFRNTESGIRIPESRGSEIIEKSMKINDFQWFLIDFPESGIRDPDSGVRGPLEAENHLKINDFQ